jgi:hypothetical protein
MNSNLLYSICNDELDKVQFACLSRRASINSFAWLSLS